ncbi:MAG: phosphohydrolase [Desulfurococcaceae archaeon]
MRAATITHWDLDGLVSASIIWRKLKPVKQVLSSVTALPRKLYEIVESTPGIRELWIADLNPQPDEVEQLAGMLGAIVRRGVRVIWVDHHEWSEGASKLADSLGPGLEIYLDRDATSAESVARLLGVAGDALVQKMIELARDDDYMLGKYELTKVWRRVLRWYGWEVRYRALESLKQGDMAPHWLVELYETEVKNVYENLIREAIARMDIIRRDGHTIIVFPDVDPRVHPGELVEVAKSNGLFAHVYVARYPRGISLRSDYVDVSEIAVGFGGGGHQRAAGIPSSVPLASLAEKIFRLLEKREIGGRRA